MECLETSRFNPLTRRRLVARFREYFDNGYRDPELLYLGGRYAVSLGMRSEAQRFLKPLADMLCPGGSALPSYAPVGLLQLSVLEKGHERDAVWARLRQLAESDRLLNRQLSALLNTPTGQQEAGMAAGAELERIAKEARSHYEANALDEARSALEALLMADGDQPDVLRNLITVTSEQQDVEAYERYWRRYVKLLLWRLARGGLAGEAWEELTRFYIQVADVTHRQLEGRPDDVQKALRRPGFLPRWLEAHAGLVWLESALKSRRTLQTALGRHPRTDGQTGNLGLMRYWFQLFYPEFSLLLDLGSDDQEAPALPSAEAEVQLHFDPAQRLLTRYLELQRYGFGLESRTVRDKDTGAERQEIVRDRHAENIVAWAGCVARLPCQRFAPELGAMLAKDQSQALDGKSLRRMLQDACSMPFFQLRLSSFLDQDPPDWEGLDRFFGDPDMADRLLPTIHLFRALALCQLEHPIDGLKVACKILPEIPQDEIEEETQNYGLWRNVVHASIGHAFQAKEKPAPLPGVRINASDSPSKAWVSVIKHQIRSMPDGKHADALRAAALEWVDAAYTQQVVVKEAVEKSQALVAEHKFREALRVVAKLPDEPAELKQLKENLSGQIRDAESQFRLQQTIEDAIKTAKAAAEKGDFVAARRAINDLPDSPEEVSKLKKEFLSQIQEAEKHHRLQKQIDTALRRTKTYVSNGQFSLARKTVRELPDSPADVKKIKKDVLSQINRAERQAQEAERLRAQIDRAIENSKRYVQNGDFAAARREIRALPDSPSEVRQLKSNLLSQIDEAETAQASYLDEIMRLLNKFQDRGVDMAAVGKIAQDNNVDISNQAQFYALLKAIDDKLF